MRRITSSIKHIATSDFPRTPWTPSFGLRKALLKAFNYARQYPDKMASLKAHLVFMLNKVNEWEQATADLPVLDHSQVAPKQSSTTKRGALTINDSGDLNHSIQLEQKPAVGIDVERNLPSESSHTMLPADTVPVPKRPKMPQSNPLKPGYAVPAPTTVEPEQVSMPVEPVAPAPITPLAPLAPLAPIAPITPQS